MSQTQRRYLSLLLLIFVSLLSVTMVGAQDTVSSDAIKAVENGLPMLYRPAELPETARAALADRMAFYHVSGVSIAVIHNYEVEWSQGYGTLAAADPTPVNAETLFQAASISKSVSALEILCLVDAGEIDLDTPVNSYLQDWQVTDNKGKPQADVTLRQLLSHTAGTTVSGFPGYPQTAELPTLEQILDGEKPANTPAIVVTTPPGTEYHYSGGGYAIAQRLVEQITGHPFAETMQPLFQDLGLKRSTFALMELGDDPNVAQALLADGTTLAGGWNQYPESTAAGLWTTSAELAKLFIAIADSYKGAVGAPLSSELAQEMVTPVRDNYGLGLMIEAGDGTTWISHTGGNAGYRSLAFISLETGDGAVILTNSDAGSELTYEIAAAVGEVYQWPNFLSLTSQPILALTDKQLAQYEGHYSFLGLEADAYAREGQLFVQLGEQYGNTIIPLHFISETEVMGMEGSIKGTFKRNTEGQITGLQTEVPGLGNVLLVRSQK